MEISFGKHKGKTIEDVSIIDCSYLVWMWKQHWVSKEYKMEIYKYKDRLTVRKKVSFRFDNQRSSTPASRRADRGDYGCECNESEYNPGGAYYIAEGGTGGCHD